MTRISLGWACNSYSGWGVYCLNLALQWSKRKEIEAQSIFTVRAIQIKIDALARRSLLPFFKRSGRDIPADLYIAALPPLANAVKGPKIGTIFFVLPFSKERIAAAKEYDLIIAGSRWNEDVLRSYGVDNVCTILQGVDPSLFHPGPKRGLYPGKFLIFSGGKTELRKGQDIVVKAFRVFAQRHPDAMLVTAWHTFWPNARLTNPAMMDLDLSALADRVIDVGPVPNALMAPIYRECDVALFPNRAEGGTNLVAMECIACGVPTILSANTGHMDLIERNAAYSLKKQGPITFSNKKETIDAEGWGESDIDEIIETLELAKRAPWHPKTNNPIADLTWAKTADDILSAILPLKQLHC